MLSISNDIKHNVVFFSFVFFVFFSFVSGISKWCHPKMVTPGAGCPPLPPPSDTTAINVIKHCNISFMPYFRLLKLTAALAHLHDGDVDLDYNNYYYNIRKLVSRWMETLTVRVTSTISAVRF